MLESVKEWHSKATTEQRNHASESFIHCLLICGAATLTPVNDVFLFRVRVANGEELLQKLLRTTRMVTKPINDPLSLLRPNLHVRWVLLYFHTLFSLALPPFRPKTEKQSAQLQLPRVILRIGRIFFVEVTHPWTTSHEKTRTPKQPGTYTHTRWRDQSICQERGLFMWKKDPTCSSVAKHMVWV